MMIAGQGTGGYELTPADMQRFRDERQRGMLAPQDSRLQQSVPAVPPELLGSKQITAVIARLHDIAGDQRHKSEEARRRRTLVGLAAPQIGEPWRIILVDTTVDESREHYGKLECFINPEIVWRSRETIEGREGCFSTGPVWGLVRRPTAVKIRAYTAAGKQLERILEGFGARIACHEIDHLDGIRFPERISTDKKRHWVHTEELLDYPEQINHWPRLCSLTRWHNFITSSYNPPNP